MPSMPAHLLAPASEAPPPESDAYSVNELCTRYVDDGKGVRKVRGRLPLTKPMLYEEINSGRLRSFKIGKRRFVSQRAIEAWIAARETGAKS